MSGDKTARSNFSEDKKINSPRSRRNNGKQQKVKNENTRVIHETIAQVRHKVKAFKKEHLGASFDFVSCSKCLRDNILRKWEMPADRIKDHEEFLKLTLRKEVDDDVMTSDEYIDLISISKRAKSFETLVSEVKPQMVKCLKENVYKSCDSLREMAENEVIIAVSVYDNNISQHRLDVEAKLDEIDQAYKSYKKLLKPFSDYVGEGEEHTDLMNRTCNKILELCKLVKNWASEDDQYPNKLIEEFESNKKVKANLQDSIIKIQAKKLENVGEMQRLKKSEVKAERCYFEHRKDKVKLKTRKTELENKKKILTEKIEKLREEQDYLEENAEEMNHIYPYSSQDQQQILETQIEELKTERKATDRHLKQLEKNLKPVQEKTYECKVDAVSCRHQRDELVRENLKLDNEVRSIRERMTKLDSYNETLLKVRDMKLSSEAYRRCKRDKQKRDVSLVDGSQDLSDACRMAAPHIGKDWQKVYLSLPFDPPRHREKRLRDLDVLDYIAVRNDIPYDDQALKSLEKWRSFHRRGNVRELIQTLRGIKKKEIAVELENKFIIC